jgi:hypothetical protein
MRYLFGGVRFRRDHESWDFKFKDKKIIFFQKPRKILTKTELDHVVKFSFGKDFT